MSYNNQIDTIGLLALKSIKGVGDKSILKILESGHPFNDLSGLDEEELGRYIGGRFKKDAIDEIINGSDGALDKAQEQFDFLADNEITAISILDNQYPSYYRLIHDFPVFLFTKGDFSLLNHKNSIAVIGTRNCTEIGRDIAKNTAIRFAEMKYNIVSGLAEGIDTAAHKGALEAGGKTTAILVSIDNILPEKNKELAEEIVESGGLLVSENPPGTFINKGEFVKRDRLQSALSLGVFPIETDEKGGTMHTVNFAEEQERLLFCPDLEKIPSYPRRSRFSRGISMLLRQNRAVPYNKESYDDVIKKLDEKKKDLEGRIETKKREQLKKTSEGNPELFK